MLTREKIL